MHIGDGNSIRCHEGSLRIGDKVVFGKDNTVNCYLDVEIGAATIVADWVYVTDFDHRIEDVTVPIKDQGIVKTPVRIGPDCWLGTKVSVLRGTRIGRGSCWARTPWPAATSPSTRSRSGRPRGWCATAWPTTGPPPPNGPRWPTSPARRPPQCRPASALLNRCELHQVG